VGVNAHRQLDVAMTSERLGGLGGDVCSGEVRYERVPQGMEVGVTAT